MKAGKTSHGVLFKAVKPKGSGGEKSNEISYLPPLLSAQSRKMMDIFFSKLMGSWLIEPTNLPRAPRFFKAWGQQIVGSATGGKRRWSPKAPFLSTTIRRPSGYPLTGCSSAEPASVSPNL